MTTELATTTNEPRLNATEIRILGSLIENRPPARKPIR